MKNKTLTTYKINWKYPKDTSPILTYTITTDSEKNAIYETRKLFDCDNLKIEIIKIVKIPTALKIPRRSIKNLFLNVFNRLIDKLKNK